MCVHLTFIQVTVESPPLRLRPNRKCKYKLSSAFTFGSVYGRQTTANTEGFP